MNSKAILKGTLLVVFSASAFGLMPILAKYAYHDGANPFDFLTVRFFVAAIVLTGVCILKKEKMRLAVKDYLYMILLGVGGYSVVAGCYFYAITEIPPSVASLILYTYPIIVFIYAVFYGEEKLELRKTIALVTSFVGLVLILDSSMRGLSVLGIALALTSAFFYSMYIIVSNRVLKTLSPLITTTYMVWCAAITLGIISLASGNLRLEFGFIGWGAILGVALVSTVLGILTFLMGLGLVGPSKAAILSTFEPVVTVFFSYLLFQEFLSTTQVLGGGLILLAAILLQLEKRQPKETKTHNSKFSENIL